MLQGCSNLAEKWPVCRQGPWPSVDTLSVADRTAAVASQACC